MHIQLGHSIRGFYHISHKVLFNERANSTYSIMLPAMYLWLVVYLWRLIYLLCAQLYCFNLHIVLIHNVIGKVLVALVAQLWLHVKKNVMSKANMSQSSSRVNNYKISEMNKKGPCSDKLNCEAFQKRCRIVESFSFISVSLLQITLFARVSCGGGKKIVPNRRTAQSGQTKHNWRRSTFFFLVLCGHFN